MNIYIYITELKKRKMFLTYSNEIFMLGIILIARRKEIAPSRGGDGGNINLITPEKHGKK